jgi:hypothetical protein
MDDPSTAIYSISFRLQRTTTEHVFVSVPVTTDVVLENPDGTTRLNVEKIVARAIELGADRVDWQREEQSIQLHPLQIPPPQANESAT